MTDREIHPETRAARQPAPRATSSLKIRLDNGISDGKDFKAGRGSLLGAFSSWAADGGLSKQKPPSDERRRDPRLSGVECLARVGWRVWGRIKSTDALIINISRGGAQVFLDSRPPVRRSIWLFLENPSGARVAKARVIKLRELASGQVMAHVSFRKPCSFAFFEAAVCGQAASDPKTRPTRTVRPAAASKPLSAG
jgi:hypothetical protein